MQEELQSQLITILPDLKQAFQQGVSYGGDLFNRAVTFFIWQELIYIAICLLLIFLSIIIYYYGNKLYKKKKKKRGEYFDITDYPQLIFIPIISIAIFVVTCSCLIESIINIIKLFYIPEVYIIELFK